MNRFALFAVVVLTFAFVSEAGAKPARGISPAMAAGVAGGKYGVEAPVSEDELGWPDYSRHPRASDSDSAPYASMVSLIWPKLKKSDLIVALTHFTADTSSHPILAEGGVYWAVRRSPHEPDEDAIAWAVLEPSSYQLLIVAPVSVRGQKVAITSHDGWKLYNLFGEIGPDGGFTLEPDGKHVRLVRQGTAVHTRTLERIRMVLTASYNAVEPIVEKLDVDPDRQPGVHGFLRVLFDLIHIVSSLSIVDGNLDPSGRSWNWGRGFRAVNDPTFRIEDFAWRRKIPSAEGTRGDKGASRWDVVGVNQLSRKVEKTYEQLDKNGARPDTSWCLDQLLGEQSSEAEATAPPPAPQGVGSAPASAPVAKPDAPSDSAAGWHADYVRRVKALKAKRPGETKSAATAATTPAPVSAQPRGGAEEVELGFITIGRHDFYVFPRTHNIADALEALRPDIGSWTIEEVRGLTKDIKHGLDGVYLIPAWHN